MLTQTTTKTCSSCNQAKSRIHFHKNKAKRDGLASKCKACKAAYDAAYQAAYQAGPGRHLVNSLTARRRARKKRATPPWLSAWELNEIAELYREAIRLAEVTGMAHHVDHIIPLENTKVCGLHCLGNLQVITGVSNLKKSNKFRVGRPTSEWPSCLMHEYARFPTTHHT